MEVLLRHRDIFKKDAQFFIGETVFTTDDLTNLHWHDFYEFFLIQKGSIHHFINEKKYLVHENELCFIKPDDRHRFQKTTECERAIMINIAFTSPLFSAVMEFLFEERDLYHFDFDNTPVATDTFLRTAFKKLAAFLYQKQSAAAFEDTAVLKSFLSTILLQIPHKQEFQQQSIPNWLVSAKKEMEKRENYELGLRQFIHISGKTQEHLTRSMRKFYDVSPTEYINKLRLHQAAYLLQSTTRNVTEIIFKIGFNNIPHFNKNFKKMYGVSPRKYRKQSSLIINPK